MLLAAGTLGGIFSTAVSIASLVSYPVLLALGVPPLSANITNTVSLVLTGAGSVAGSRPELAGQGRRVLRLGIITALGGAVGAIVLLLTPASTFTFVVPVLIGGASLVLLVQPVLERKLDRGVGANLDFVAVFQQRRVHPDSIQVGPIGRSKIDQLELAIWPQNDLGMAA